MYRRLVDAVEAVDEIPAEDSNREGTDTEDVEPSRLHPLEQDGLADLEAQVGLAEADALIPLPPRQPVMVNNRHVGEVLRADLLLDDDVRQLLRLHEHEARRNAGRKAAADVDKPCE